MKIAKFKIEEWMNKYESIAKYDMTTTCIDSFSLETFFSLTNTDMKDLLKKPLHYGDITGSLRLKNNVANLYKNQSFENVSVTLGAIGANSLVFKSILEKNDEVVSVIPTYQQHYSIPEQIGAKVKILKLKPELNWHIDLNELDNIVSNKTKLITINNPNNPTGSLLTEKELLDIVSIVRKHNAYILSDEVYRFLNHSNNANTISIADIYEKGISTFSMSKTFSLAGIRVGFAVASKKIIDEINHQRQYDTISISMIDDYISCIALENKEKILKRNLEIVKKGKCVLENWVKNEPKVSMISPEAGTTAFISYSCDKNSYDFCYDLFKQTGVLLLPGDAMEIPKHCRIGYCGELKNFESGLEAFSNWLQSY